MENKIMCPICHHQANHEIYSCEICLEEDDKIGKTMEVEI